MPLHAVIRPRRVGRSLSCEPRGSSRASCFRDPGLSDARPGCRTGIRPQDGQQRRRRGGRRTDPADATGTRTGCAERPGRTQYIGRPGGRSACILLPSRAAREQGEASIPSRPCGHPGGRDHVEGTAREMRIQRFPRDTHKPGRVARPLTLPPGRAMSLPALDRSALSVGVDGAVVDRHGIAVADDDDNIPRPAAPFRPPPSRWSPPRQRSPRWSLSRHLSP